MKIRFDFIATITMAVLCLSVYAAQSPSTSPTFGAAAESAKSFLKLLDEGKVDDALKLWDSKAVDAKLKARIEAQSAKLKSFGGISRVDVGTPEARAGQKYEKQTGEKIDVVPVEIICHDGNLLLATFSVRHKDGAPKIFLVESLKEWGGTASLDEEKGYSH